MARTLATLLGGGLPLVNALDIAAQSIGNQYMARELDVVSARVREGESFAAALEARGVFPDVAVKMAEVGESTGALQEMLNTVADFYDEEIATNHGAVRHAGRAGAAGDHGHRHRRAAARAVHAAVPAAARCWPVRHVDGPRTDAWLTSTTTAELHADPAGPDHQRRRAARAELEQARRLAERYRLEFVDMDTFRIDQDLFRSIPADLMLRYGFVPYRRDGKALVIVVSDPTDLPMIDELGVLLATPIKVTVGAAVGDRVDPEEERELAARARGGDRELPAAAAARKTTTATRASPSSG